MTNSSGRPHQVSVSDSLWEVFSKISTDSGSQVDELVNQAMFEMAVRLGYLNPVARDAQMPASKGRIPVSSTRPTQRPVSEQKFASSSAREAAERPSTPAGKRPPRPAPRMAVAKSEGRGLYISSEDGATEKIDKDIYIIGRSSKCDLVINSVKVSREHAIITREKGEYYIEDLGSANGTWYKGEKIEKMKIRDGDEIFICDEKFKFNLR